MNGVITHLQGSIPTVPPFLRGPWEPWRSPFPFPLRLRLGCTDSTVICVCCVFVHSRPLDQQSWGLLSSVSLEATRYHTKGSRWRVSGSLCKMVIKRLLVGGRNEVDRVKKWACCPVQAATQQMSPVLNMEASAAIIRDPRDEARTIFTDTTSFLKWEDFSTSWGHQSQSKYHWHFFSFLFNLMDMTLNAIRKEAKNSQKMEGIGWTCFIR